MLVIVLFGSMSLVVYFMFKFHILIHVDIDHYSVFSNNIFDRKQVLNKLTVALNRGIMSSEGINILQTYPLFDLNKWLSGKRKTILMEN